MCPTYAFECENCEYKQQKLVSILYPKKSKCPKCLKNTLIRLIGGSSGFVLKGNGFFRNDYPKEK